MRCLLPQLKENESLELDRIRLYPVWFSIVCGMSELKEMLVFKVDCFSQSLHLPFSESRDSPSLKIRSSISSY
jgi:hypothetical protein